MRNLKLTFAFLLMIISFVSNAQQTNENPISSYDFHFKIDGVQDTSIILGQYYGNRIAYRDTAMMVNGEVTFKRNNRDLNKGVYALVLPIKGDDGKYSPLYFDVFVSEPKIDMYTNVSDIASLTVVKKSEENKAYYKYLKFIQTQRNKAQAISSKMTDASESEKAKYKKELDAISKEVEKTQDEFFNGPLYVAKFLKMSQDVKIPTPPADADSLWKYNYYVNHYFDNFDFTDDNILHTIIYYNKLDYYFQKALPQVPDSIIKYADVLLNKVPQTSESFKYIVNYLSYKYETSKIICMDAVFVHMALNYYATGKVDWVRSSKN